MTSIQPLQQKSESRDDVRTEFERGLEEFIRGHLDECISFGSCSSVHNPEDGDEEGDQLVRRRRRSELEGDNLAESSAARRRQSQILEWYNCSKQSFDFCVGLHVLGAKLLIPKSRRRMVTFWTKVDEDGDVADEFLEEGEKQINSEVLLLTSVDEFEFEKKRNRPERYDRNVTENTLMAIKKIDNIKSAREAKQEFWFLY